MKNIKVYIATHKKTELPKLQGYIPIQVGADLHDDLGYIKDNFGDNISKRNPNFCELTALYWIWKNEKEADIIGLSHYRRYFFYDTENIGFDNILPIEEINKILDKKDIILPKKLEFGRKITVKSQYYESHHTDDLLKCGKIIDKLYPKYSKSFKKVLKRHYLYAFNMFIMKKENFDKYMEWLFNIFDEFEKDLDLEKYDSYNKRVFGFLSERLFNVWILNNKLKIKEIDVSNIDENAII